MIVGFALLIAAETAWIDPKHEDIPAAMRGTWAIAPASCIEKSGPAFVEVGRRHLHFYERYAYLSLARINGDRDDPSSQFVGYFSIVEGLNFAAEPIRMELRRSRLVISEGIEPEGKSNPVSWTRCSSEFDPAMDRP